VKWNAVLALLGLAACAAPQSHITDAATAMAPLMGCWRGEFVGGPPDATDRRCFERLEPGHVVDTHHVWPTAYRGETTYHFDDAADAIVFAYAASDGGRSNGEVRVEGSAFVFPPHTFRGSDGACDHAGRSTTPIASWP